MNAEQAKAKTYEVRPPQEPPSIFFEEVAFAVSSGRRSINVSFELTEEQTWWIQDAGYSITSVASFISCNPNCPIKIEW